MDSPSQMMSGIDEPLQTPGPPTLEDDDLRLHDMNGINHNGVLSLRDYSAHDDSQEKVDLGTGLSQYQPSAFRLRNEHCQDQMNDIGIECQHPKFQEIPQDSSQFQSTTMIHGHIPSQNDIQHVSQQNLLQDPSQSLHQINHQLSGQRSIGILQYAEPVSDGVLPEYTQTSLHENNPIPGPDCFSKPSAIPEEEEVNYSRPLTPVSADVQQLMREALDFVSESVEEACEITKTAEIEEIPSSPEPEPEAETPIDDFLSECLEATRLKLCSGRSEQPMKDLIVTSKMDDEVTEVLSTYMKSQFGELRKRTAMHLLAIDERVGSYQTEIRRISAPLLEVIEQMEDGGDMKKVRERTGDMLCLLRMLNERMLIDRRTAILNFFERPTELASVHRMPHRDGDALFGKRFCYLNGLGFTKRRPRRKPARKNPAEVSLFTKPVEENSQTDYRESEEFEEEYDEEEEEEEEISDEEWKVSEDEENDPEEEEEEEVESELESDEQDEIHGKNVNPDGTPSLENLWKDSVSLSHGVDGAVRTGSSVRKEKKGKKKDGSKRGRKKKAVDPSNEKPTKKRTRRRSTETDGEGKRRKKDGPTIERKIDPHCEHCDFEADRRHLIMHVRKAHPDKMIQCEQCPKKFAFKVSLWNHVVIMHGSAKFKCSQCTRSFRSEEKLRMHSFMHSDLKPFACEICGKGCLTKRHLDAHVLIHEQRQQLYCQMCDRYFATNHNFRNHMKLHTGQKDFFCDICNAGFPIKARLTQHKRLHHSGEQYVCDICGKAFKARHILNDHKALRHSTEKSWVCEVCGAGFKLKSVLVRHLKTHSDERPFRCDICDKAFKDRSTLGVHRKTHSTDRPYLCEQCGMSFKRNAERKKHNCIGRTVHIPEDSSQSQHGQLVMGQSTSQPQQHIVTHRTIPIATLMPHPASMMSPATPGTSLQAQIMQLLDENLHAAGSQHPQNSNFTVS